MESAASYQLKYISSQLITEVKCCLSVAANPLCGLDLINCPILVVGSVLIQS